MIGLTLGLLGIAAFVLARELSRRLLDPDSALYVLDLPNERSLHEIPTPRGGGLAIAAAVLVIGAISVAVLEWKTDLIWLGLAGLLTAGLSYVDDRAPVHPGFRISAHFVIAFGLAAGGFVLEELRLPGVSWALPDWTGVGLCVLYIVWMLNLYNFMDGMDGFAAGMAVLGFGSFAVLGLMADGVLFAAISLAIAAAAGGFLCFNFPPARLFMGDVGSSFLGLLAAGMSLWADREQLFPLWIGVVVFSPFIVDATVTLGRRVVRGERVWRAHRSHFYQRLVQIGWGHRKTVLWEYSLMVVSSTVAIAALMLSPAGQWLLLCGWGLAYTMIIVLVYRLEATYRSRAA